MNFKTVLFYTFNSAKRTDQHRAVVADTLSLTQFNNVINHKEGITGYIERLRKANANLEYAAHPNPRIRKQDTTMGQIFETYRIYAADEIKILDPYQYTVTRAANNNLIFHRLLDDDSRIMMYSKKWLVELPKSGE